MAAAYFDEIFIPAGLTIDQAYEELLKKHRELNNWCAGEFNGVTIHSGLSLDECYKRITGHTKDELGDVVIRKQEEPNEEEIDPETQKQDQAEEYTERAKRFLKPDKMSAFEDILKVRMDDIYHGMEIGCMLDIIEILVENEDEPGAALILAKDKFESQNHSGMSAKLTALLVKTFSPVLGIEFFDKVYK